VTNIIKIENKNGELFVDSRLVAKTLGVEHESIIRLVKEHPDDFRFLRFEIGEIAGKGQPEKYLALPEREALLLLTYTKNTDEAKAAKRHLVDAFLAMHKKLQERAEPPVLSPRGEALRESLAITFEFLRPAESGKILLMRKAFKDAGLPIACLPDYCEEQVTQSATALLKKFGSGLSAISFNHHMERLGFLSSIPRPSSKGGVKYYWSITEAGLKYGKNLINENNPKETQPHWYEKTFPQLLKMAENHALVGVGN
jgi:phage regulator Rha-like protein